MKGATLWRYAAMLLIVEPVALILQKKLLFKFRKRTNSNIRELVYDR